MAVKTWPKVNVFEGEGGALHVLSVAPASADATAAAAGNAAAAAAGEAAAAGRR